LEEDRNYVVVFIKPKELYEDDLSFTYRPNYYVQMKRKLNHELNKEVRAELEFKYFGNLLN